MHDGSGKAACGDRSVSRHDGSGKAANGVLTHAGIGFTAFTRSLEAYDVSWFLLERDRRCYLIDTGCGPLDMLSVQEAVRRAGKPLVVVNTHFHWDHVWGNCMFPEAPVVAHERCRRRMREEWTPQVEQNRRMMAGDATLRLPDVCFNDRLSFPEDGILLFHTPGHTDDSISVWDTERRLLIAGDNLERPLVYVEDPDLDAYRRTLAAYIALDAKTILAAHAWPLDGTDIRMTDGYLRDLAADKPLSFPDPSVMALHQMNRSVFISSEIRYNGQVRINKTGASSGD